MVGPDDLRRSTSPECLGGVDLGRVRGARAWRRRPALEPRDPQRPLVSGISDGPEVGEEAAVRLGVAVRRPLGHLEDASALEVWR